MKQPKNVKRFSEVYSMTIDKSSGHPKTIGDFGENLICNWLSRSGFEVTFVDHTGIDILAHNPKTDQRLGITVKSRVRKIGAENELIYVFSSPDQIKIRNTCRALGCEPWVGIYVETTNYAGLFLTSIRNYREKYLGREGKVYQDWKTTSAYRKRYAEDNEVKHIRVDFDTTNWNWRIVELETNSQ